MMIIPELMNELRLNCENDCFDLTNFLNEK